MRITLAFLLLLVSFANVSAQQSSDECGTPRQPEGVLVVAFRVLDTAEMSYNDVNHRFATVSELVGSDETKKLLINVYRRYSQPADGSVEIVSADDPLPGYEVHSIVGADGKSYSITATKKDGPCRGIGAATDERCLIYLIEPLR